MANKKPLFKSSLEDLIKKYEGTNVVDDIQGNYAQNKQLEMPLDKLFLSPLFKEENYNLDDYVELEKKMEEHLINIPLLVREKETEGEYEIIDGIVRFLLAKKLNFPTIGVTIIKMTDDLYLYYCLVNLRYQNTNPIIKAYAYREAIKTYKVTQKIISGITKESHGQVTNTIRLLLLDPEIQKFMVKKLLSYGQARAILTLRRNEQQIIIKLILSHNYSVREVEKLVYDLRHQSESSDELHLFGDKIGANVKVQNNRVTINFKSRTLRDKFFEVVSENNIKKSK